MYNLQTRKNSQMVQTAQIELSMNSNTTRRLKFKLLLKPLDISKIWFKVSTDTIYWLTKWLKKSLEEFTDQMKKAKKVPACWKLNFHKGKYLKPSNIYLTSIVEFTDSTHIIYWPTNIAKKAENCWKCFCYICIYVSTKYLPI